MPIRTAPCVSARAARDSRVKDVGKPPNWCRIAHAYSDVRPIRRGCTPPPVQTQKPILPKLNDRVHPFRRGIMSGPGGRPSSQNRLPERVLSWTPTRVRLLKAASKTASGRRKQGYSNGLPAVTTSTWGTPPSGLGAVGIHRLDPCGLPPRPAARVPQAGGRCWWAARQAHGPSSRRADKTPGARAVVRVG